MAKKKVGLALSSGGARGFAHVGVIKILEKNGIPIDYICGNSMGSIVAAYYALFGSVDGLEEFARHFKRRDLFKFLDIGNLRESLIKGERAMQWLEDTFGERTFKDTIIPLKIGATTLEDGKEVVFDSGPIVPAVLASCSLPGFLPPFKIFDYLLLDGCIIQTVPINAAYDLGADIVIAVDVSQDLDPKPEFDNIIEILMRTNQMTSNCNNLLQLQQADLVIKPHVGQFHWSQFSQIDSIIKNGVAY